MSNVYYWSCLLASIVFEVAGTSVMKLSQESWPVLGMGCMYLLLGLSYFFLARAVVKLPVGVAYAFWEGLGLTLITIVSVLLLGERLDATRLAALCMVLAGTLLVHHGTEGGDTAGEGDVAAEGGEDASGPVSGGAVPRGAFASSPAMPAPAHGPGMQAAAATRGQPPAVRPGDAGVHPAARAGSTGGEAVPVAVAQVVDGGGR